MLRVTREALRRRSGKKKYCQRCDRRTNFLFDHDEGMFICSEHEL